MNARPQAVPTPVPLRDRIPPHDLEAEEAALGAGMVEPEQLDVAMEMLEPADFYAPLHLTIFAACVALRRRGDPVDKVSVAGELRRQGFLEKVGGGAYLSRLIDCCPTTEATRYYARVVAETALLRRMIKAGLRIVDLAYNGEPDVAGALSEAHRLLEAVHRRGGS